MAEEHRLRLLQVGVAGHEHVQVRLGLLDHGRLQRRPAPVQRRPSRRSRYRRRSVATWSLRQRPVCSLPATGAHQLAQAPLDGGVDVLIAGRELEGAALELCAHLLQPVDQRARAPRP